MSLFQPIGVLTTNNFLVQIHKGPSLRTMPAGLTEVWECALIPDVRGTAIDRRGSTQFGRESAHRKVPKADAAAYQESNAAHARGSFFLLAPYALSRPASRDCRGAELWAGGHVQTTISTQKRTATVQPSRETLEISEFFGSLLRSDT